MFFKIQFSAIYYCAKIFWVLLILVLPSQVQAETTASGDAVNNSSLIPLYISAFFSLGGTWDGSGIIPGVEMALDDINAREDILSGYELRMIWNDTKVKYKFCLNLEKETPIVRQNILMNITQTTHSA